ncbi:hypothetical protein KEM55_002790, partial [Ascosphaera atra]
RDYVTVQKLIAGFGEAPERKVQSWSTGGAMYDDFLHLVNLKPSQRDPGRLMRLVSALTTVGKQANEKKERDPSTLIEKIAFRELSQFVATWAQKESAGTFVEPTAILRLPLTQSVRAIQTAEMSRRYYGAIMTGGV